MGDVLNGYAGAAGTTRAGSQQDHNPLAGNTWDWLVLTPPRTESAT